MMNGSTSAHDPVLETFVSLQAMKELRRQGAIFYGERMMEADTIAGHSFTVACLAWFIAERWNKEHPESKVNVQKVLEMGLCHDMGEAITGDIPAPFKSKAEDQGMGGALENAELAAFKDLILPINELREDLPTILEEFDKLGSKEAAIVKVADRLDAYVHALATQSVHRLVQAWGFYNKKLYDRLNKLGENCQFWQWLADWFRRACSFLGSASGLCPAIPRREIDFDDPQWLPEFAKRGVETNAAGP